MVSMKTEYDVIVVGGGHAGLEAAMASAHMGMDTLLCTLNIKMMGNMPCNPSIGGSAKGIVVREIDALGGMMGIGADHEYLQMKMLNTGKGPGVQCLRAQADKKTYPAYMQHLALNTNNLSLLEAMVVGLLHDDKNVFGVELENGEKIFSKAVILTTGTYMESEVLVGHARKSAGPDGENPSRGLSPFLAAMGIKLMRLKTGTPQRIKRDSIDFSKTVIQLGTPGELAFSYTTKKFIPLNEQEPCYLTYTTEKTHQIIREHLLDSAMYGGCVRGVGPRYCPSIEDKIVRFADKPRHQLFLEPESRMTDSIYLQGFSTSMPQNVQDEMVHSLPGLEKAVILKYAYAIEYDAIDPFQLLPTLEMKKWPGLYIAGQICGTSGYEEAAGLGLMAGINAVRKIQQSEPIILRRDQAYIGVMIDDIVTKGVTDPYRLLSSRAEYRLLLRHDNADLRLTKIGYDIGLINEDRYRDFCAKNVAIEKAKAILATLHTSGPVFRDYLDSVGYPDYQGGLTGEELLRRPNVSLKDLLPFIPELSALKLDTTAISQLEVMVKYVGYINKQIEDAQNFQKMEELQIPMNIEYQHMDGLALEARQKLDKFRPLTIGQASRISGINPSDVAILIMNIRKGKN